MPWVPRNGTWPRRSVWPSRSDTATARWPTVGRCVSSEILIRAAELSDADAIQEIFNQPRAQANTLQLPWRSLGQRRDWLARVSADGHLLVAEIDGRVVGQLGLHVQTAPRRRDVGGFGMAVHDDFQGRGVGTALMQAMIELADKWLALRRLE